MSHENMKVIHLIPHDGIGGVEAAARSMATAKKLDCGFSLLLIAGSTLATDCHRIIESPFRSANNPLAHALALGRILRSKPDVLVCSLWRSMLVGLLSKILRPRTRVVCFLHLASTVHILDYMLNNLMMRCCDEVWADSSTTLNARCRQSQKKPKVVISFVLSDPPTNPCRNTVAPKFVFWGRLHHQKGIDRAIEFIAELVKSVRDTQFEIWGPDDGEKTNLISLVREKGLKEHVHFMGAADPFKLVKIASDSAFYLQLSRVEGMAMSVVEAMQFGLVPVVTPVGEIAEYCRHGENAVVVQDPDNSVESVNEVIMLLGDEDRYRHYQNAAQEHWRQSRLYSDDVCRCAERLMQANADAAFG